MIFRKMRDDAIEPVRSTKMSAGLDLFAVEDTIIPAGGIEVVKTGITFELTASDYEHHWFIGLYIRSSLAVDGLMLGNGTGVVDADYEWNEIKVILYNTTKEPYSISAGQKIAQMITQGHMSNLAEGVTFKYNERLGGFGSSGK